MFDLYRTSLFFADEPSEGGGDEGGSGGGGGETDLDKLRAAKDTEIAELSKQVKDATASLSALQNQINAASQTDAVSADLQKLLDDIDAEEDPERVKRLSKQYLSAIGQELGKSRSATTAAQVAYKEEMATRISEGIAFESGGKAETYKARLMQAKTPTEMQAVGDALREQVKASKGTRQAGDANGNGGQQRRVDNNSGRPQSSDILAELNKIDVMTPEGRAEFTKREAEFAARIKANAS